MMRRGLRISSGGSRVIDTRGGLHLSSPSSDASPPAESSALVSGAGTGQVNVIHTPRGTANGRNYYNREGLGDNPTVSAISWDGGQWTIYLADGGTGYLALEDVAEPWEVSAWLTGFDGSEPPPTVTEAP